MEGGVKKMIKMLSQFMQMKVLCKLIWDVGSQMLHIEHGGEVST